MAPIEQLNLKDLNRHGKTSVTLQEAYTYDDLSTVGDVMVQAQVHLSGTGVSVFGKYAGQLQEPCNRCAELTVIPFEELFEDKFVYANLTQQGQYMGELELHEEDFYDTIGPDNILDVKDLIRQHIILLTSTGLTCNQPDCTFEMEPV